MEHDPAKLNRLWSRATQDSMEAKLGRSLSDSETDKIWNTGSFLELEQIDMAILYAKTVAELEAYLAALPLRDRLPDEFTRRDA